MTNPSSATTTCEIPTGNTFDKYGSQNPVVRRLMTNFQRNLDDLFLRANPKSVLDVGCGEGILSHKWATRMKDSRVVGIDLDDEKLKAEWQTRKRDNLEFLIARGEKLPFSDDEFDIATAIEVLEHVEDPEQSLAEMARCARNYLLVSVPREPLWRAVNMARGAYLSQFGNTPGHVNHWSKKSFVHAVGKYGKVVEVRSPFPWTQLLVRL